jgi:hypothetical protein
MSAGLIDRAEKYMTRIIALVSLAALLGWAASVSAARTSHLGPAAHTSSGAIVLGSKSLYFGGRGWGTARPSKLDNNGDPSGIVWGIRWQHWGQMTAIGWGSTWIPKPTYGYYGTPVRAELRATDIGRCSARGPLAYRHLYARVPSRPGGGLGPWFTWGNLSTLCHK